MTVLFSYYHEQEKNLGDVATLQQAAAEAGLDAQKVVYKPFMIIFN
jgi:predicted DsbA family dithiol-disulfide isomerase